MKRKVCVRSMVLGAVIMLIGLAVGAIVSPPLIAQRNGVFDEIQCSRLKVVSRWDESMVDIGSNAIIGYDGEGEQAILIGVRVFPGGDDTNIILHRQGKLAYWLQAGKNSNTIQLYNQTGKEGLLLLAGDKHNGVSLLSKEEKDALTLSTSHEYGNRISVLDKEGNDGILLRSASEFWKNEILIFDEADNIGWSAP